MSKISHRMATYRLRTKLLAAALLLIGAVGGWGFSSLVDRAGAVESRFEVPGHAALDGAKLALVGTYVVTGTDPEGRPYAGARTLDVAAGQNGDREHHY